ncbi:hypothetical protein MSPP1_000487 [Malassezia sp. CBS 17886]|nr:hypothetical protein MSPP1_000487 [Malassezia sp. CBS 17886]
MSECGDISEARAADATSAAGAASVRDPLDPGARAERRGSADAAHAVSKEPHSAPPSRGVLAMPRSDQRGMLLLVVLYMLQGVPIGLAFGTMPYLLKAHLSYTDIGTFMLCTYPYSLKLLWSPIVDSLFLARWRVPLTRYTLSLGRRKSWIVPIQFLVGGMLYWLAGHVDTLVLSDMPNVYLVTGVFTVLIFLAATQDIAVDGWALTLLSDANLGYASTAQTVGINIGYFMSFTVFLAFNSVEFSNKYFRLTPQDDPVLSLAAYLRVCGVVFCAVNTWLLLFQHEHEEQHDAPEMGLRQVYEVMWRIARLRHVQLLALVHLVAKIGFQTNEAVMGLKLVENGLGREDLALAVLVDFPFQLIFGYMAASWGAGDGGALRPWLLSFVARLIFAAASMGVVYGMPGAHGAVGGAYFALILLTTVLNSFASTVQFVSITAFHTLIADPVIGGTYMTLLNTVSNLGGTWPRYFVLKMVDYFSVSQCGPPPEVSNAQLQEIVGHTNMSLALRECVSDEGKAQCTAIGGTCTVLRDGYYWTNTICVALGVLALVVFIIPACRRLQKIPPNGWRVPLHAHKHKQA